MRSSCTLTDTIAASHKSDLWLSMHNPYKSIQPIYVWNYQNGSGALQWRHNGCDGVSNHQRLDCLLNRLFKPRSKKISKRRVTGLCEGNWIRRWPMNSPHKGPVTRKMFPFGDIVMLRMEWLKWWWSLRISISVLAFRMSVSDNHRLGRPLTKSELPNDNQSQLLIEDKACRHGMNINHYDNDFVI